MTWGFVAVGTATALSAAAGADASRKAANSQKDAANAAAGRTLDAAGLARADSESYRNLGDASVQKLAQLLGVGGSGSKFDPRRKEIYDSLVRDRDLNHINQYGFSIFDGQRNAGWAGGIPQGEQLALDAQADALYKQRYGNEPATAGGGVTPQSIMEMDPGYQFRLNQGLEATKNAALAKGGYDSGATLKALTRYGQDYASNEYGNVVNRLSGAAGLGQASTTQGNQLNVSAAGNVGEATMNAANARAAGIVGGANSWGNAASGAAGAYSGYQNRQFYDRILNGNRGGYTGYGIQGDYQYG